MSAERPGDKAARREEVAHEARNWIRLTSRCNNLCVFCLDTLARDHQGDHGGTLATEAEVKARIIAGRRDGATRLILSGGEPTIHPQFVKFIRYGRLAGYRRIQTVTNGRMFSYPEFLDRCLSAGLQEITFSVHGHNARVHDALVGVKGAFDEEVRAIQLALADGRPIVNLDVCLNKGNVRRLPKLLDRFIALGVHEFDLLHLIPFGAAWDPRHRDSLVYDIDEAMPFIQSALKRSEEPGLHIWFNRFPPPYLEGYEHLIQDPHKLHDEARGRFEEYELWLTRGVPLSCREPARCERCYLQPFCDAVDRTLQRLDAGGFDAVRLRPGDPPVSGAGPLPEWIVAPDIEAALALAAGDERRPWILELASARGAPERLAASRAGERPLLRALASTPADVQAWLGVEADFEVCARLDRAMAAWLLEALPTGHPRLALALPTHARASGSEREDPDLRAFFDAFTAPVPVEGVPACMTGRPPRPRLRVLDAATLRRAGPAPDKPTPGDTGGGTSILAALDRAELSVGDPAKRQALRGELSNLGPLGPPRTGPVPDLFGLVDHYLQDGYFTKSHRCRACRFDARCEGMHINHVRAHGYAAMQPVTD